MVQYVWTEEETETFLSIKRCFQKNRCDISLGKRPPSRNEAEEEMWNTGNNGKTLKQRGLMEKRNLCSSGDSSVAASAVVGMEINLSKCETSAATLLEMT